MKERTNFVHSIQGVHVVSLPQVKGQLWGKQKENSISLCGISLSECENSSSMSAGVFKGDGKSAVWTPSLLLMSPLSEEAATHPSILAGLLEYPVEGQWENILYKTIYARNIYPYNHKSVTLKFINIK